MHSKRIAFVLALALMVLAAPKLLAEEAKKDDKLSDEAIKKMEALVEKTMKGYNEEDSKAFWEGWAKSSAPVTTEDNFKKNYVGLYKNKFMGKLVSKSRDDKDERVVLKGLSPVLIFKAEFEKKKESKINAAFTKEGDEYKLIQLNFD
ncbi:MAG: hypothetical protein HY291_03390 [Planctomycetes bacterium]|nr:hypothetical protein [Planctomycetota bacterium]